MRLRELHHRSVAMGPTLSPFSKSSSVVSISELIVVVTALLTRISKRP